MGWVDIVFIGLIVVLAIIGLSKGLFESILGIFSSILSIVIAIMVQKPVTNLINKMVDTNKLFSDLLIKWKWINESGATIFGKTYTVEQIGNVCTVVVSILAVWLLIKLAILLLSKLFDSATSNNSALSGLNRVLGLIFGAAKGMLIGCVGLGLAAILQICGVAGVKDVMEQNKFSNYVYGYVGEWVGEQVEDRVEDFLGKGKTTEEGGEQNGEQSGEQTGEGSQSGEQSGDVTGDQNGAQSGAATA